MNHHDLIPIITRLEENNISYSLGGSGLLYSLRLIDTVNDWDITIECPKEKLLEAINEFDWVEGRSGDYPFASQYRINLPSINVEFIGYFAFHTEKGIFHLPMKNVGKWDNINLSSPEIWYVAYSLMKRQRKAELILEYLRNNVEKVNSDILRELLNKTELSEEIKQNLSQLI
ncbi:hypothetical protein [Cohnella sp.]|uniref:hypothetical protein n=1 Tax=Cohnella sp. TaxID=1883426 RepID=UPI003566013B